jgi:hypothetical protein
MPYPPGQEETILWVATVSWKQFDMACSGERSQPARVPSTAELVMYFLDGVLIESDEQTILSTFQAESIESCNESYLYDWMDWVHGQKYSPS